MLPSLRTPLTAAGRQLLLRTFLLLLLSTVWVFAPTQAGETEDPFREQYEKASDKQKARWQKMAKSAGGLIASGRYSEATALLKKDGAPESLAKLADLLVRTGRPAKALALMDLALKKHDGSPALFLNRGRALEALGHYGDAYESYELATQNLGEKPGENEVEALLESAGLLAFLGRRTAVMDATDWFYSYYQTFDSDEAMPGQALSAIGRAVLLAAEANEDYKDGFRVLTLAQRKLPDHLPTLLAVADAYQSKYQYRDAEAEYRSALEINPRSVRALTGLARVLLHRRGFAEADRLCRLALSVNPRSVDARQVLMQLALVDEDVSEAERLVQESLDSHPGHPHLLLIQAALAFAKGDEKAHQAKAEAYRKALAVLPYTGQAEEEEMGSIAAGQLAYANSEMLMLFHRVEDALVWARKAVKADPEDADHLSHLGIMLMRNGLDDEAADVLKRAFAKDSFNVWVYNLAQLTRRNADYERFETSRFGIRVLKKHLPVLKPYVKDRFDTHLADCEDLFGFKVKDRIEFSILRNHSDFSARVTGLPHLDASGATFGPFVALVEPMAWRKRKRWLDWQSVALHEIAHVVTLKGSGYKIPRWLTEGMSVYAEGWINPDWDVPFKTMVVRGPLPDLAKWNRMFHRPEEGWHVPAAYHGAGLFVNWLVEAHGKAVLAKLVKAFGEGEETEEAFVAATGRTLAELQAWFHTRLVAHAATVQVPVIQKPPTKPIDELIKSFSESEEAFEEGAYLFRLIRSREPEKAQKVADELIARLEKVKKAGKSNDQLDAIVAEALVFVAGRMLKEKPDRAETFLALAAEADAKNAHADFLMGVARIAKKDYVGAATWLERARVKFPRFVVDTSCGNPYNRLLECYDRLKKPEKAVAVLTDYINIRRNAPDLFRDLARRLKALDRPEEAIDVYSRLMAIDPFEAGDHESMAALLTEVGKRKEAERELAMAKACAAIAAGKGSDSPPPKDGEEKPDISPRPVQPVEDEELKNMLEGI